jgi:hypothetical protein
MRIDDSGKRAIIHASVPAKLAEGLKALAVAQDRSLSGELRRAVAEHLHRHDDGSEEHVSIPENLRGQHHPRDPMTEPRPRVPLAPDGRPQAPSAGTADQSQRPNAGSVNPHPAAGRLS